MKIQTLRPQIAIVALALGATLCSVPAFAQARSVNDGGQVSVPAGATLNGGSHIATAPNLGRNVNDGGIPAEPTAAQVKAAQASAKSKTAQKSAPQHFGRNVDDGGPVDVQ
jgi:hypothetical protein